MTEEQKRNLEQLKTYDEKMKKLKAQYDHAKSKYENLYTKIIVSAVRQYGWSIEQFLDVVQDCSKRVAEGRLYTANKTNQPHNNS